MLDIAQLKAQIRAILLALGRGTTEREFRKEYYEIEGKSFNEVLRELGFFSAEAFLLKIPDVCRVTRNFEGELFIQRVSCEDTAHMDHLTIVKKKKRKARPTFRFDGVTSSRFRLLQDFKFSDLLFAALHHQHIFILSIHILRLLKEHFRPQLMHILVVQSLLPLVTTSDLNKAPLPKHHRML